MNKYISILIFSAFVFCSCHKVVVLKLNNLPPALVIQGEVTDSAGPYTVLITQTADFYADNTFPPVSGAFVTISANTGIIDSLTETSPGVYVTHTLQGVPGNTYTLSVLAQGKSYIATSTMPMPVPLDSITFQISKGLGFGKNRMTAIANFQDPPGIKNYYQFVLNKNGQQDNNNIYVYDDRLSDGRYINHTLRTDSSYLNTGDSLKVKMYSIDENVYNYFYQFNQSSGTGSFNTAASPANPTTNISNGAYGYFSAHTVVAKTIIVP